MKRIVKGWMTAMVLLGIGLPVVGWSAPLAASGGDVVYDIVVDGDIPYRVHVFTNMGPAMLTVSNAGFVDGLLVGGGGGGGETIGGGGGGGGVLEYHGLSVTAGVYTVTVGAGGAGGWGAGYPAGSRGSDSTFDVLTAVGGGAGAGYNLAASGTGGSAGGNGGGGGARAGYTPGQGSDGGVHWNNNAGGGGGGAGATGADASAASGGKGGDGRVSEITGSPVYYAGGGGGGTRNTTGPDAGTGGPGGGGDGGRTTAGQDGTANTGGGGGGGGFVAELAGGSGGSGIVIVRYSLDPMTPAPPVTLADPVTGSERFTNTNGVRIAAYPVYAGYDRFQSTGEDRAVDALESDGWVSTNDLATYSAGFDWPSADTNITLYIWFTNTTDTAMPLLRSAGSIYFTSEPPVPVVRSALTRGRLAGEAAIVTVADIDTGSEPGTANGTVMDLHAQKVRTVNPAVDLTPDKPYASIGSAGEYPVVLWLQNEAGNAAYSSVTCLVTVVDLDATTNFWTGGGTTVSWNDPDNWLAGVPADNQHAAITQAVSVVIDRPSWALRSFTMTAGTLTFTNWTTCLQADTVDLQGGTVTLPPPFTGKQMPNRVWIVCSNLTVASTATINADARGYARENGPGIVGGTYGGSYGGRGNGESGWVSRPATYGSVSEPVDPGSGGWSTVSTDGGINTGAGGGAIRIDASGAVAVHGTLTANGGNGPVTHASGGSGGAILVYCRTFGGSSTGLLSAKGGNGNNRGGAAGGGRIAVVYDPTEQAACSPVNPGVRFNAAQAAAGGWSQYAEAGTLYFPDTAFLSGTMTTQWQGGDIRIPGFTSWTPASLSVAGIFGLPGVTNLSVAGDLNLLSGGNLSLVCAPTNTVLSPYGLTLTVGGALSVSNNARLVLGSHISNGAVPWVACDRLFVAAGGVIDADSKGYGPHGESAYPGPGGGAVSTYGAGASHGGQGSTGNGVWSRATQPYGNSAWPLTPGSAGGGGTTGLGGYGGGVIAISAASTAEIHGTLTADGGNSGSHGGTGSGGSILIACDTFLGSASGLIQARGGRLVANSGGAGAGGRIAILYDSVAQAALPQPNPGVQFSTAPGYTGTNPFLAEPGTLYLPDADALFLSTQMGTQWQDVNLVIPEFTEWEVAGLQIAGKFFIDGLETLRVTGDLTVNNGGRLTLFALATNVVDREIGLLLVVSGDLVVASGGEIVAVADLDTGAVPYIDCGSLDVQAGGKIVGDSRGFDEYEGPGRGTSRGGGGYGGPGSRGADVLAYAGPTNGVAWAPVGPGSGAGNYDRAGGRGGGSIRVGAQRSMTVDGSLSANGMVRLTTHAGSGSGGGILLSAGSFSGAGTLSANGANSSNNGGAGGGGRIAVWTPYLPPETMRLMAARSAPPIRAEVLDPAMLHPGLTLSVAAGTGGTNPAEAGAGTVFFGHLAQGMLIILR